MRTETDFSKSKTSFYIYDFLKAKMAYLVPAGKQTELVNNALQDTLEKIEKQKATEEFLIALKSIKKVKRKTTARQTLEKLREERDLVLLGSKANQKTTKRKT